MKSEGLSRKGMYDLFIQIKGWVVMFAPTSELTGLEQLSLPCFIIFVGGLLTSFPLIEGHLTPFHSSPPCWIPQFPGGISKCHALLFMGWGGNAAGKHALGFEFC